MLSDFRAKFLTARGTKREGARVSAAMGCGIVVGYTLRTQDHSGYMGGLVFLLGALMLIVGLKGMHDAERHK